MWVHGAIPNCSLHRTDPVWWHIYAGVSDEPFQSSALESFHLGYLQSVKQVDSVLYIRAILHDPVDFSKLFWYYEENKQCLYAIRTSLVPNGCRVLPVHELDVA